MQRFTLDDFSKLSNWTQEWLSNQAHFDWGYNPVTFSPRVPAFITRVSEQSRNDFKELCQHGPLFCAALQQWSDQIVNTKPNSEPVACSVGFIALHPPRYQAFPKENGLSAHHIAEKWIGDIGRAIAGYRKWTDAALAGQAVEPGGDNERTNLVGKLCFNCEGVETTLCLRMQDELSKLRVRSPDAPGEDSNRTKRAGRKPKGEKLTNELMKEILESKPESQFWTIREFMEATGRSKGSIGDSPIWKKLEKMRLAVKAERRLNAAEKAVGSKRRR